MCSLQVMGGKSKAVICAPRWFLQAHELQVYLYVFRSSCLLVLLTSDSKKPLLLWEQGKSELMLLPLAFLTVMGMLLIEYCPLDCYRVKNLKNTPIYVKPQLSSGEGVVTVNVMVGIRADPGKPVDSIVVQLPLPPAVASSDLSANHGTVTHNHNTKVLIA